MEIKRILLLCSLTTVVLGSVFVGAGGYTQAGEMTSRYRVLSPIIHGNLTIFPVVAASTHATHMFLTLDEGLRSGEVVVTEAGNVQPLLRRPLRPIPYRGAEVNKLVLMNNSDRPLLLLAGEIVTGGKQDRVIAKDRIVAPGSDPIDLNVFCVEPHRWVETSAKFGGFPSQMAQPSLRKSAMADKDQQRVWARAQQAASIAMAMVPGAAPEARSTSSYARVMDDPQIKKQVDSVAAPVERSYEKVIRELRDRNAVGVVVAVNGQITWADIFASTSLLEKYWPKLVRSYAAEAMTRVGDAKAADSKSAQAFVENLFGRKEVVESEPGVYKHTEITGDGFTAFELTSLLPQTGFDVHIAKMAE